jgi:hypothetical protein
MVAVSILVVPSFKRSQSIYNAYTEHNQEVCRLMNDMGKYRYAHFHSQNLTSTICTEPQIDILQVQLIVPGNQEGLLTDCAPFGKLLELHEYPVHR